MEGTILSDPFLDSVYGRHNLLDFRFRYSAGEELLCHFISLLVAMWRASLTVMIPTPSSQFISGQSAPIILLFLDKSVRLIHVHDKF